MLSMKEIRTGLMDRNMSQVARRTGLHKNTVMRIARGEIDDPKYRVVKALSDYMEGVGNE